MKYVWLLEEGSFGYEHGEIIGAFNDKKDIPAWIRMKRPGFRRLKKQEDPGEFYFENYAQGGTWIRCNKKVEVR